MGKIQRKPGMCYFDPYVNNVKLCRKQRCKFVDNTKKLEFYFMIFLKYYFNDLIKIMTAENYCFVYREPVVIFYNDPNIDIKDKLMVFRKQIKTWPTKAENIWLLTTDILARSKHFYARGGVKNTQFEPANKIWLKKYYCHLMLGFLGHNRSIDLFDRILFGQKGKEICSENTLDMTEPLFPIPTDSEWKDMIALTSQTNENFCDINRKKHTFIPTCFY